MPLSPAIATLAAQIAELVHADRKREAAQAVAEVCKINLKLGAEDNPAKYIPVLTNWLHYLLNSGGTVQAAQLLWTPNQFYSEPQFLKDIWKLYEESQQGLILGGASCCKSFGMGVRLYLEYIRDPEYTAIKVLGPSQDHLEANLFSQIVGLHTGASLPMPGFVGELFIGLNKRNQLGSIKGVVIPLGRSKKAGRVQGTKCKPRPKPHPILGPLSRVFIFMDEVENIPEGIWSDVGNVLSQISNGSAFKIFGALNPRDRTHEVAKRVEPPFGWEDFDPDSHYRWKSRMGWDVLRLDGEKSENVTAGRTIFPGLQTREGLEAIAKDAGGREGPEYATMGRGHYPKQGVVLSIIPPGMFAKWRGEFIWYDDPRPLASCDLALEGGDAAEYTLGKWGRASGMKLPSNFENPKGRVVMFKNAMGQVMPRFAVQADQMFTLPKGDTVEMSDELEKVNKKAGVKPEYFSCDRTGVGTGVADVLRRNWGPGIHDVNFYEGASESKLMLEDTKTCLEEYERMCSELWFALRAYGEHGYFLINPAMDVSILQHEVTTRLMKVGKRSRVESKKDYMERNAGKSPNKADSLTLFIHAARKGSGVTVSRVGDSDSSVDSDEWYEGGFAGGVLITADNRTDFL